MITTILQTSALMGFKNLMGGLLIGATTLLGNPDKPAKPMSFDASVYVTKQGKIKLSIQKVAPGSVSVALLDQKNNVLFANRVAKKEMKAALLFDMSEVEDGLYTLEIRSDEGVIQKQVNLGTSKSERLVAINLQ
ncbi:hypothetical protein GGR92_003506 [Spirosoma lacussanchae]|uniref:hypothetical protein n=1 Tax=Spirosoma lacussanchae TaxID=1884249 RepID=UPI001108E651|nr:hypothetical protein [Spirosoma lacussanchae]